MRILELIAELTKLLARTSTKVDEVAPPGYEKVVKGIKKKHRKGVNPWAIAWSMKNKGIRPKK